MFYLDPQQGLIEFRGVSCTDRSYEFYHEIWALLDQYLAVNDRAITANLSFEYFNTSSSKCIFDFLKRLKRFGASGKTLTVNWYFNSEDNDMKQVGEDYASVFDVEFNFIESCRN